MQINDEGIIIKKKKYRESSLLITFFSLNQIHLLLLVLQKKNHKMKMEY